MPSCLPKCRTFSRRLGKREDDGRFVKICTLTPFRAFQDRGRSDPGVSPADPEPDAKKRESGERSYVKIAGFLKSYQYLAFSGMSW